MNVKELRDILNNMDEHYDNSVVCVRVTKRGSMGSTPSTKVKSIVNGFDWDSGKCIIYTESDITEINNEEILVNKRDINLDNLLD